MVPSWFTIAAAPEPEEFNVNKAGIDGATLNSISFEAVP
jgi:hypothetical protein